MNVAALGPIHRAYLPAHMTTVLQPMDQGIIKNVKILYTQHLIEHMLLCMDNSSQYEASLLSAMYKLAHAWDCVKDETIVNCLRACGFVATTGDASPCVLVEMQTSELNDGSFGTMGSMVQTCSPLTDSDIAQTVKPNECLHESGGDDDTENEPQPKADVAASLAFTQHFSVGENDAEEALLHFSHLKNFLAKSIISKQQETRKTGYIS